MLGRSVGTAALVGRCWGGVRMTYPQQQHHQPGLFLMKRSLSLDQYSGKVGARSGFDSPSVDMQNFPPNKLNQCINICPQGFQDIVTRFGSYARTASPGLYFAIPFIESIQRVDMREMTLEIQPCTGITQDNVSVQTGGALYVQVIDPQKACFAARRPLEAILIHAISVMRSRIGTVELDSLFHERKKLNDELVASVSGAAEKWGLQVLRYELTDVIPDYEVSKAMDAQATAERRRRETILNADAQRQKLEKESEGMKQSYINVAVGEREKVIMAAEAAKKSLVMEAEGKAEALDIVGAVLEKPHRKEAMNFLMAQSYVESVAAGLKDSSTVFLQKDVTDVSKMMAQGMAVLNSMPKNNGNKGSSE
uniref:Band 7 domain-containing protein n=1 Tax=Paramoeba aestuarina TaxID=180227 RepID=A0A7S4KLZ1_9EUKA|mmetsp:Transcript_21419/g.33284  ORF Transcript_21419/g.33284 Transcript_21419/m.33284 type:complete len:366 (+) Transcript_21419:45-1142(+)